MKKWIIMILLFALVGCTGKKQADLIVFNARVYTLDNAFSIAESFAVKGGKIVAVGKEKDILAQFEAKEKLNAGGKYIFPGFIDAHCHFYNYGKSLQNADLRGTDSFDEVLDVMKKFNEAKHPRCLIGRGWDQNDWPVKEFPDNSKLDELFPDLPVVLTRIDGHAVLVNSYVLNKAGISGQTKVDGGEVLLRNGKPTGVLIDNAVELVNPVIPKTSLAEQVKALLGAEKDCFAVGLTTVADAGLDKNIILLIDSLQQSGRLKMKVYAMLSNTQENIKEFLNKGIYKTDRIDIRSIKLYADGALGSRGACLFQPYSDDSGNYGLMVENEEVLKYICLQAFDHGYQVNVHAIGDSGVHMVLKVFSEVLPDPNDRRWRIEHAQVVDPNDFKIFREYSVIPSVQPTHATSDMYWAEERLGPVRIRNAYAYKKPLDQNGWIAFGTDFPVEKIDPVLTFYAAVFRKDVKGFPENGWQMENAVTREQALKAMTIWAAKACFEDEEKGSIEPGKAADFIILDKDIYTVKPDDILKTSVLKTYINGQQVYYKP
jgi:hypothetical protein